MGSFGFSVGTGISTPVVILGGVLIAIILFWLLAGFAVGKDTDDHD